MKAEDRFWRKVTRTATCWIWVGAADVDGYGRFWFNGRIGLAHHASLKMFRGLDVPTGYELDHTCGVHSCVNPEHLDIVTHAENNKRRWKKYVPVTHCIHGHKKERPGRCLTCGRAACRKSYWAKKQAVTNTQLWEPTGRPA